VEIYAHFDGKGASTDFLGNEELNIEFPVMFGYKS
jgi:hypothetical protein